MCIFTGGECGAWRRHSRLASPFMLPEASSGSVELLEEWDRASRVASDCSMLRRLLEVGNCRYFSGTYPTCPALFLA